MMTTRIPSRGKRYPTRSEAVLARLNYRAQWMRRRRRQEWLVKYQPNWKANVEA
jgi:hypothetical protein